MPARKPRMVIEFDPSQVTAGVAAVKARLKELGISYEVLSASGKKAGDEQAQFARQLQRVREQADPSEKAVRKFNEAMAVLHREVAAGRLDGDQFKKLGTNLEIARDKALGAGTAVSSLSKIVQQFGVYLSAAFIANKIIDFTK